MRRFLTALVLASLLVTTFPATYAQRAADKSKKASVTAQRAVDTISANQIKDYLTFIASDEMEGRDTPSRGLDTTAKFLAVNLARWGFKPAGDAGSFFQRIDLRRDRADNGQTKVELNGRTLTAGTDYLPAGGSGNISGQLVFAGSGWFLKSKDIDAYKGIDPAGKIAVIFGTPNERPRMAGGGFGKPGEDFMTPVDYARSKGVAGLIYVPDFQYLANWQRNRQRIMERGSTVVAKFQSAAAPALPSIVISPETANLLFAGEPQSASVIFNASYGSAGTALPAPFLMNPTKTVTMTVASNTETVATQNVVAMWEGSDPVLKNEYVALGAHYDHVGNCAPAGSDPICNGADDDGSGTTALLGMAEALAKAPTRPKRSILFVWHCGEEKGLWGSRYFTENPTIPINQVITQLNIDMIGRTKTENDRPGNQPLPKPGEVFLIGSKLMSTELGEISEAVNKSYLNLAFNYRYDDPNDKNRFFYRSDHFNYAAKGIPIIFYMDGEHDDYHRVTDSVEKIDYQNMETIARTVFATAWDLANRPTRPRVDKPLSEGITKP